MLGVGNVEKMEETNNAFGAWNMHDSLSFVLIPVLNLLVLSSAV